MKLNREAALARRHKRVRAKVSGTPSRPRLAIHRSLQHIYAQLIDDEAKITLSGFGTLSKGCEAKRKSKEAAREVGKQIAEFAKKKNINSVVFDRGRYKFHGIVAELANSAREAGLQF